MAELLKIRTLGKKVGRWFPLALVHGEGDLEGEPFELRDDQQEMLDRWFAYRDDYDWLFDRLYNEEPKGVGKTMLLAGLAIEHALGPSSQALGRRRPNVVVAATSIRQAGEKRGGKSKDDPEDFGDGIFGRVCQVLDHDNCPLKPEVKLYGDRIAFHSRPGGIRLIPSRASTVDGGLPTLYVADEVQDWTGSAAEAFDRVGNSTTKSRGGRVVAASTPGHRVGAPSVGWRLRHYGDRIRSGEIDDEHYLFVNHEASRHWDLDDPDQLREALLEATPGLDERRLQRLMRRRNEIHDTEFRRFHLAQWVDMNEDSWLVDHPGAWANCQSPLEIDGDVWVGVDMSLRNDLTAVGWCARVDEKWVVRARVFEPVAGVVDHLAVMAFLRELADTHVVRSVAYDPRYFEVPAQMLADEGIPMEEVPQTHDRMSPACMGMWEDIVAGRVAHNGDPVLAQHVNGAARREYERGWTLSKGKSREHIDAAIAVILARRSAELDLVHASEVTARWL